MKPIISPSILSCDFTRLGEQLSILKDNNISNIHFDVMDGIFVPNISFGAPVLKSIKAAYPDFVYDVHMMVDEPDRLTELFAKSGAGIITVHQEACTHIDRTLNHIKELGCKCGVVLNPGTPIELIAEILPICDTVLLMSVNPGFGGQKLIPYVLDKAKRLNELKKERGLDFTIQIDGGINADNIKAAVNAGITDIVAGSSVFNGDIAANIKKLYKAME